MKVKNLCLAGLLFVFLVAATGCQPLLKALGEGPTAVPTATATWAPPATATATLVPPTMPVIPTATATGTPEPEPTSPPTAYPTPFPTPTMTPVPEMGYYGDPSLGFERGFDIYMFPQDIRRLAAFRPTRVYRYVKNVRIGIMRKFRLVKPDAEYIGEEGTRALMSNGREPFFIWCHFMDPHHDYWPPGKYVPDYPNTPAEVAIKYHKETRVHNEAYKEEYLGVYFDFSFHE